ncbi:MAG: hypothetical protein DRN49_02540, partial [Thaumarchaeota archaeon]
MPARWYDVEANSSKLYYHQGYQLKENAFFIETKPILSYPMVNTSTYDNDAGNIGGYSETFNFTVRVTDEDGDTVTAYLYIRKWNETANDWGPWEQVGFTSCVDCNSTLLWRIKSNFDCSDIGEWQFKWNASDDADYPLTGGQSYTDETLPQNFTVEQDDIELQYVYGSGKTIWRNGTQSVVLSVKVWDVDDQRYLATGEAQGKVWITYDHNNYDSGHDVSVLSGYFNYTFDPDNSCFYDVGTQYWIAGTTGNSCFKDVNSSVFNLTLKSYLSASIISPNGEPHKQGDLIPINFFVYDECNNGVPGVARKIYLVTGDSSYTIDSASITDHNNGTYTYQWDSTAKALGWYNLTVEAQKDYYELVNETKVNAFHLGKPPELQLESVDRVVGGWGETWTFTVECRDLEGDSDNVTLWMKRSSTDPWIPVETQQCQATSWTTLTFTETFACSNITPSGENTYWKFNASDQWNFTAETDNHTITIEKDDVSIGLVSGNDEDVNREGSDIEVLKVQVYDTDRGEYVSGAQGIFHITYDGNSWDSGTLNTTDASGYLTYYFDPNCSYSIGVQKWKAGTYNDACYKDKFSVNYTLRIWGQLKNNIVSPYQGQIFHTTELVPIRLNVSSDCLNEGLIANASVSIELRSPLDVWESCSPVYNESGDFAGYYNCTWDSTLKNPGYWDIRLNSSKDYYNSNSTFLENWFYLQNTEPSYTIIPVSPNESGWGDSYNYSIQVDDVDNDDVTCTLYISTDGGNYFESKTPITITGGHGLCSWLINFTCSEIGNDNYYYFVLDDGYNTVTTSTLQGPNITKDTLQISLVSGDGEEVNRNSGTLTLKVYVYDQDKGSAVADNTPVKFNITYDGTNYLTAAEVNTSLGYAAYDFSPDCTYQVGYQNWTTFIEGQTCYFDSYSDTWNLTIKGTLSTQVIQPLNAEEFYRGENVSIRLNISEDCNNLIDPDYLNVSVKSTYTNDIFYLQHAQESLGYYNATFNSSGKPPRYYDIRVYAEKQFHNLVDYTETDAFWIETLPTIQLISTSVESEQGGSVGGWGETWTFRVNVTDEDLDQVQVWFYERPGGGEWNLKPPITGKSKAAGVESAIIEFTTSFVCDDLLTNATHEFFFNGTDDYSTVTPANSQKDYAESSIGSFSLERDDISISLVSGNNAILNRSNVTNGEKVPLRVQIQDLDTGSPVAYNDLGQFWVTYDGTNYRKDLELNTIEPSGYITDNFPSSDRCLYDIGPQKWKVLFGQSCYKPTWSTPANPEWNLTLITTPLEVSLIKPNGESYRKGIDTVDYLGYVYDDCGGVASALVDLKAKQGGTTHSAQAFTNASGYVTYSFDPSTWTLGYYNATINASKTYYNSSDVLLKENAFVLVTQPTISALTITTQDSTGSSINPYGWGETWIFDIDLYDEDQGTFNFEKLNVSLWINTTSGWKLLNSSICSAPDCKVTTTITYKNTFTCSDMGTRIFNVTATDYWNYTASTTQQQEIIKDDVVLYATSAPSDVDREDETVLLQAQVYDRDKGEYVGSGVEGTIKITYDNTNYGSPIALTTDSSGYLSYNFNPNCSYSVGIQNWRMDVDDECYTSAAISGYTVQSITVYGQLKNNLLVPVYNSIFNVTDQVLIRFNTTSDCSNEGLITNA